MNWFKNPWDNEGEFSPDHVKEGIDRWFNRGGKDEGNNEKSFKPLESGNIELSSQEGDLVFELYFKKSSEGLFYQFEASFIELDKRGDPKTEYNAKLLTINIPSFYGNTLELDPTYSVNNPFKTFLMSGAKTATYNKQALTVYDVLKKVMDDSKNIDRLDIVVIGNYARIHFGKDDVFRTEADKTNKNPSPITEHDFMQSRATTFRNTFLIGLNSSVDIIDMAADDPRNTYKDLTNYKTPNPLDHGGNLEGISVLFFPKAKSLPKF
jgi:hypothetical protein